MRKATSLFILLLISIGLSGQDRYMVFFKDKANSPYSLNNPSEYLSQRSISRRLKNSVSLSEQDLPVNPSYVDQLNGLGIETYYTSKWMNGVLVQMEETMVTQVEALNAVDRVEYVAPGTLLSPNPSTRSEIEEDPLPPPLINQNHYEMLELDLMHQAGFLGTGVLIGVFDDGFNNYNTLSAFRHAVQDNRIIYTQDFTKNRENVDNDFDHGLRAFSLIAADDDNLIGGAPGAQYVLAVTEASGEYRIEEYNWLFAAERADSIGVDLITSSLGYSEFQDASMNYTVQDMDGLTTVVTRAANIASSKGIVVVSSAGNTGATAWGIITAPADSEVVIAVGATDSDGLLAGFSAVGPSADGRIKPDVVAQGVTTPVLRANGAIAFQNGTSFSAPLVTSLVAGLIQAFPEMTAEEIRDLLRSSGDNVEAPNNSYGYGIPGFIRASIVGNDALIPVSEGISTFPNPIEVSTLKVAFAGSFAGQSIDAQLITNRGALVQSYRFTPGLFENTMEIDLSNVKAGLLLLRLITPDGVVTKKILKTR